MARETIYGDRTVHARAGELEIVRYDRAGKWYQEYVPPRMRPASKLTLAEAALLAFDCGAEVFLRKPGGGAFDRRYARLLAEHAAAKELEES